MLKSMLAFLALVSTSACMGGGGAEVTRENTGSFNGCAGLTGVSAQYSQTIAGLPVRCGPQSASPVTYR